MGSGIFNEESTLGLLRKYLPEQLPLKDFVHHNTLHAFQDLSFFEAMKESAEMFGYQTLPGLHEYRGWFKSGKIKEQNLDKVLANSGEQEEINSLKSRLLNENLTQEFVGKTGALRQGWKKLAKVNLDRQVHPALFRVLGAYLDQGISIWKFPDRHLSFLEAIRKLEHDAHWGLFRSPRVKNMLAENKFSMEGLLDILVADPTLYEDYLMDILFSHPGWSGMVSVLEEKPHSLLYPRRISLKELILFELLLEIDALDRKGGTNWKPLGTWIKEKDYQVPEPKDQGGLFKQLSYFQEAMEWSFFDEVLSGILVTHNKQEVQKSTRSFQALFCIDDRECSLRRHLENIETEASTYGTAGHFNLDMYFLPEGAKYLTKVCPVPVEPKHIIREHARVNKKQKDVFLESASHGAVGGWVAASLLGLWSGVKMMKSVFVPSESPVMVSSFEHMHPDGEIEIDFRGETDKAGNRIGFTWDEMADRMEALLLGVGIRTRFDSIIYLIAHGSSSINNPYYSGYDCGACSGRPGSANSRAAAQMLNHPEVRNRLKARGIQIPEITWFIAGLHDTTRDEIHFYDTACIPAALQGRHQEIEGSFQKALLKNSRERARRFRNVKLSWSDKRIHQKVKTRSYSLFEPRPEWNHANNALCLIGNRGSFNHLFLDRRAFMHSYAAEKDPDASVLAKILETAIPVCGGINLEYYFSTVDNNRHGAGSKLSHNIAGLIGVVNGIDGDLRTGLPAQMVNIHEPLRMLFVVEQNPDLVLKALQLKPRVFQWVRKNWVHCVAFDRREGKFYRITEDGYNQYIPDASSRTIPANKDVWYQMDDSLPIHPVK
ncbi:MAG: DUF2309 family protein [Bacteroidetes bacterium]|nr:DUF2309 family protein [Bacteroidota bacterium]